jgi:hypothetical protein
VSFAQPLTHSLTPSRYQYTPAYGVFEPPIYSIRVGYLVRWRTGRCDREKSWFVSAIAANNVSMRIRRGQQGGSVVEEKRTVSNILKTSQTHRHGPRRPPGPCPCPCPGSSWGCYHDGRLLMKQAVGKKHRLRPCRVGPDLHRRLGTEDEADVHETTDRRYGESQ